MVGLVVSVFGFLITIWQLIRTANAAKASTRALEEATQRLSKNHLLVVLPQVRLLENDLDAALADDDKKLAIRTLVSYSHAANQLASLLAGHDDPEVSDLIVKLKESAVTASAAKATLVSGTTKAVRLVARAASEQIGAISSPLAGLTTQYQVKVD